MRAATRDKQVVGARRIEPRVVRAAIHGLCAVAILLVVAFHFGRDRAIDDGSGVVEA